MHGSAHYQWEGAAPYNVSGPLLQGKKYSALNSYCVNIVGNWGACGNCHVGLGAVPTTVVNDAQLANIDCLVCHQERYVRKKVNGVFVPDLAAMTISMDQAVQTVHSPTRATCVQCHGKGGGGDNYKRGDLAVAHAKTADRSFDVHMATTGADLDCQQCHTVRAHRFAGRGSDLRETDLDITMACATSSCHRSKISGGHDSSDINRHIARVACQTCHVGPVSARNAADTPATEATEIFRDWRQGHATPTGAIHPTIKLANNIKPVYRFWNGFSDNYSLGDVTTPDVMTGRYATSRLVGSIADNDPVAKLYPFKYKTAVQPLLRFPTPRLIPLDTRVYFATGDYAASTAQGIVNMGWSGSGIESVETDTLQLLTHEIAPRSRALTCNSCHGTRATQMNLKALGYELKGPTSTVCTQCHGRKESMDWRKLHTKHVKDKKFDCSVCHTFSRPERGGRTALSDD